MQRKILITGGLGYLGVKLANYLSKNPQALNWNSRTERIKTIDLLDVKADTPNKRLLKQEHEIFVADPSDNDKTLDYMVKGNYDTIFHFGGAPSGACQKDPYLGQENIKATETVLVAASRIYKKGGREKTRVIFPSSLLAFENIGRIYDCTEPNAKMPYGKSKLESERKGAYCLGADFRALRVSTVIARREPSTAVTAYNYNLPNKLLMGEDCTVPVDRNFVHPIIWIDDVINGFVKLHNLNEGQLAGKNNRPYRVFNITSHPIMAEDWASIVESYKNRLPWKLGDVIWKKGTEEDLKILNAAGKYINGKLASSYGITASTSPKEMVENIY